MHGVSTSGSKEKPKGPGMRWNMLLMFTGGAGASGKRGSQVSPKRCATHVTIVMMLPNSLYIPVF